MEIKAFKMDGLGNDFVIIDQRSKNYDLNNDQIIKKFRKLKNKFPDKILLIKNAGLNFYHLLKHSTILLGNSSIIGSI